MVSWVPLQCAFCNPLPVFLDSFRQGLDRGGVLSEKLSALSCCRCHKCAASQSSLLVSMSVTRRRAELSRLI